MKKERVLTAVVFSYMQPHIAMAAKKKGNADFGSLSAYLNYLVAKDMGDLDSAKMMIQIAKERNHVRTVTKK